ncbi:DNA ligase 1 [Amblyraja radiata]|uniref:DNA ligase 1 n=1 Tax=Amblyraja radiata TaxID=386614 RepID=UPI001402D4B0|nr:DNA ligase 1 [Amblyraja radiata]
MQCGASPQGAVLSCSAAHHHRGRCCPAVRRITTGGGLSCSAAQHHRGRCCPAVRRITTGGGVVLQCGASPQGAVFTSCWLEAEPEQVGAKLPPSLTTRSSSSGGGGAEERKMQRTIASFFQPMKGGGNKAQQDPRKGRRREPALKPRVSTTASGSPESPVRARRRRPGRVTSEEEDGESGEEREDEGESEEKMEEKGGEGEKGEEPPQLGSSQTQLGTPLPMDIESPRHVSGSPPGSCDPHTAQGPSDSSPGSSDPQLEAPRRRTGKQQDGGTEKEVKVQGSLAETQHEVEGRPCRDHGHQKVKEEQRRGESTRSGGEGAEVTEDQGPKSKGHGDGEKVEEKRKSSFSSFFGKQVPYLAVAVTFEKIEGETARGKIVETLSNFLRSVIMLTPTDLLTCLYLALNRLAPAHHGLELGVGEGLLLRAVAQATGRQVDRVKQEVQVRGDLGLVAESSRSTQRRVFTPPPLSAFTVYHRLMDIAQLVGSSSMTKKMDVIKGLLVACRLSEARYLIRSLGGKLRIGLAEQSVLSALALAVCLTDTRHGSVDGMSGERRKAWIDEQTHTLKQTYCEMPDFGVIVPLILEKGIAELPQHCRLTPGTPLKPMLAHPTRGVGEVMRRFTGASFICEYKYDGERAQIHVLESGDVHIYSRNQENNTTKYPDIISRVSKVCKAHVRSCVLDTEAVAWDRDKRRIQPFQVLTTRKRKDVDAADITVQVCVYAFDLLYLNGESLVKEPFSRRRQLLRESFEEIEGEFVFAESMIGNNTEDIAEFLEQSIKDSCEGLMVKTLDVDATYEIAKRSHNWLKLKKDYLDGVGDSLDLVVIGGYHGRGKRTGVYGGFLLACYHPDLEEFHTVCKIGTGFKDEELEQHANFLKAHVLESPRPYYCWDSSAEPDVWFDAVQVWEVKCADLSVSPIYKAALGMVEEGRGISLRFPRFLRVREDKQPEEATSSSQIADLYQKQQQIQNQQVPVLRDDSD